MDDDRFDAIIVGAGIAGSIAAHVMARAGLNVLIIERGNTAGSKNMTGGRLYAHSLEKIMPGFAKHAPVERKITREKLSFLTADSAVTLDYQAKREGNPVQESYSILRSKFDPWLIAQAEAAGAQFISGIRVDELISENNHVIGVKAGDDILMANVVILAEGINALLSQSIGLGLESSPKNLAIGIKEIISLPQQHIEDRFNVNHNDGTAWLFAGSPSDGLSGGGFVYTNKDSISLGVVCHLQDIGKSGKSLPQMLDDFKNHPAIAPLIQGGKQLEYSAHMVSEQGINAISKLSGNGVLVIGDAAGLGLNLGFTVRGMDMAITSADAAAQAVIMAKKHNNFSEQGLSLYLSLLKESHLMDDMTLYKNLPAFLHNSRLFNEYPDMAANIMRDIFTIDGTSAKSLLKKLLNQIKRVGIINLLKDLIKGARAL